MKFRYRYTGRVDTKVVIGNPIYETIFLSESGDWKKLEMERTQNGFTFPVVETGQDRFRIDAKSPFNKTEYPYNYYEYEVDIDELKGEPIKAKLLHNYIMMHDANRKYRNILNELIEDSRIEKNVSRDYFRRLDFYGGVDASSFRIELGICFPEIYNNLPTRMFSVLDTFRFILKYKIDYNSLLSGELEVYNNIKRKQFEEYQNLKQ